MPDRYELAYWAVCTTPQGNHEATMVSAANHADALSLAYITFGEKLVAVTVESFSDDRNDHVGLKEILWDFNNYGVAWQAIERLKQRINSNEYRQKSLARVDQFHDEDDGSIHIYDDRGEEICSWSLSEWRNDPAVVFSIVSLTQAFYDRGPEEVRRRTHTSKRPITRALDTVPYPLDRIKATF